MRPRLAVAGAGGAVMALAIPPADLLPAVFAGLAILAWTLRGAPSARSAFACGTAWASVGGVIGFRFVPAVVERFTHLGPEVGVVALLLLAALQGLAWGVGAAVAHLLARRARLPFAAAFAAGAYCACSLPALFGWTPAALLSPRPELVQLADAIGERGVSLLIALIAALLAEAAAAHGARRTPAGRRAGLGALGLAVTLLAGVYAYGALRMSDFGGSAATARLRVALVDQDVSGDARLDARNRLPIIRRLRTISARADAAGANLVVWPESAYPVALERPLIAAPRGRLSPLSAGMRAPRLIGLVSYQHVRDGGGLRLERFNSATIVTPGGRMQPSYDKVHLLWFGETLPLADRVGWLRGLLAHGGIQPGSRARPLLLARPAGMGRGAPIRLGVLTCYEDILPGAGLGTAREGRPQLLVNLTNNSWFAGTSAGQLHARLAVMRAVELRTDLVRAVNEGDESWIDAAGRVRVSAAHRRPGFTLVTPSLRPSAAGMTLYARFGDLPVRLALLVLVLGSIAVRRRGTVRDLPIAGTRRRPVGLARRLSGAPAASPSRRAA